MLRIGMVGMGGISGAHIGAWLQIPEAKIICVCDIRPEKANAAAEKSGGKAYLDFDEMLESEKIDVLDICLPTFLHADFAVEALGKGIHVLVEKPISLKKEDIERVYGAAQSKNTNVMVAQVLRFWREFQALKEAYESGMYGKLLSGHMVRLGSKPKWSWDNWMADPSRSGLVPFDLHIHDLDFMIYAFGTPENLICHRGTNESQDYINAIYEFKDFFITAEASWFDCKYRFRSGYRFQFEKAVMEYTGGVLTIYHQNGEMETLEEEQSSENGINLPKSNAYFNEIRYFADCVLSGKPCDMVKPQELRTVLELIDRLNEMCID